MGNAGMTSAPSISIGMPRAVATARTASSCANVHGTPPARLCVFSTQISAVRDACTSSAPAYAARVAATTHQRLDGAVDVVPAW